MKIDILSVKNPNGSPMSVDDIIIIENLMSKYKIQYLQAFWKGCFKEEAEEVKPIQSKVYVPKKVPKYFITYEDLNKNLLEKIEDLRLSVRAINRLKSCGIEYLGELAQCKEKELLNLSGFGANCLKEVKEILSANGLSLGSKIVRWKSRLNKHLKLNKGK